MGSIVGIIGVLLIFLRFPIPIMIGAYFAAKDIWHWEWYWALLFSCPSILLIAPTIIIAPVLIWWDKIKNR